AKTHKKVVFPPHSKFSFGGSLRIPSGLSIDGNGVIFEVPYRPVNYTLILDSCKDNVLKNIKIVENNRDYTAPAGGVAVRGNSSNVTLENIIVEGCSNGFSIRSE